MKLWLLRHARAELPAGLCYGASDVPANAQHNLQAAHALAPLLPKGTTVWVSGLQRAQQLARALRTLRPDLPRPHTDARLNEMNFGCWELMPWNDIARQAFDLWMADFAHHRFGGVESTQQVIDRVATALLSQQATSGEHAVWITHAGVIRAVQFIITHGHTPICHVNQWPTEAPGPGEFLCVEI
jgi:alpha-ribazole phosphatase